MTDFDMSSAPYMRAPEGAALVRERGDLIDIVEYVGLRQMGHSRVEANKIRRAKDWQRPPAVDCTDAADLYWRSEEDVWDFDSDFGPLRAPFGHMWMEARLAEFRAEGDIYDYREDGLRYGCPVVAADWSDGTQSVTFGEVVGWAERARVFTNFHLSAHLHVDADGKVLEHAVGYTPGFEPFQDPSAFSANNIKPFMFAMSLMNCRNVEVIDAPETRQVRRARERDGRPKRPRRLLLPSAVRDNGANAETRQQLGGAAPLHLVRGHFKTYTEEAPLFGKVAGTYWWGHHVRGVGDTPTERRYDVGLGHLLD